MRSLLQRIGPLRTLARPARRLMSPVNRPFATTVHGDIGQVILIDEEAKRPDRNSRASGLQAFNCLRTMPAREHLGALRLIEADLSCAYKSGEYDSALDKRHFKRGNSKGERRSVRPSGHSENLEVSKRLIKEYGKVWPSGWLEAVRVLSELPPGLRTDDHYFHAIAACGRAKQPQQACNKAMQLYAELQNRGSKIGVQTYSAMLSAMDRSGNWKEGLRIFEDMRAARVVPNNVTFISLGSIMVKSGQWDQVLRLLDSLPAAGVLPDVRIYTSLISAVAKSGQSERAQSVYKLMRDADVEPNARTFTALIGALALGGQWAQVQSVLEDMRAAGVEPNGISYNALIGALAKGGKWEQALGVLDEMKAAGHKPEMHTVGTLVGALEKGGQWERAASALKDIQAAGPEQTCMAHSALIKAMAKCGQWEQAMRLLEDMQTAGMEPDLATCNAVITALGAANALQWERALAVFENMQAVGMQPDVFTYNALIGVYSKGEQWKQVSGCEGLPINTNN